MKKRFRVHNPELPLSIYIVLVCACIANIIATYIMLTHFIN